MKCLREQDQQSVTLAQTSKIELKFEKASPSDDEIVEFTNLRTPDGRRFGVHKKMPVYFMHDGVKWKRMEVT